MFIVDDSLTNLRPLHGLCRFIFLLYFLIP